MGAIGLSLFVGQEGVLRSAHRVQATLFSERAIEAARAIRDTDFEDLVEGQHGICIGAEGKWALCGAQTEQEGYTTVLTVEPLTEDHVRVSARTDWDFGTKRFGSVTLSTELTNWRITKPVGNWAALTVEGVTTETDIPFFNSIAVAGNYAFVTSEISDGGAGLYIFDITDLSFPLRIASGFQLNAAGYHLAVSGTRLFVCTNAEFAEVQVYDISTPSTFSSTNLLASIDLPGAGRARSLSLMGDTLFIGALESATDDEFYAYDVLDLGSIELLSSLSDEGASFNDMGLKDGYAYLATSLDLSELRVIDVFDPEHVVFAPGNGFNLTDVHDGTAVAVVGSRLLFGRAIGDAIEELILFDLSQSPVPSASSGKWYQEMGASVKSLAAEPGGQYAFVATDSTTQQLLVIDPDKFASGQVPILAIYKPSTGGGRAVMYDPLRDRLFFATEKSFYVFRPG